ncbi:hypothetical protein FRC03_003364 [Tulasnella sp. 419]|nr:hypothetical protein FRC03_003364 [Tulasnella sp. 419]
METVDQPRKRRRTVHHSLAVPHPLTSNVDSQPIPNRPKKNMPIRNDKKIMKDIMLRLPKQAIARTGDAPPTLHPKLPLAPVGPTSFRISDYLDQSQEDPDIAFRRDGPMIKATRKLVDEEVAEHAETSFLKMISNQEGLAILEQDSTEISDQDLMNWIAGSPPPPTTLNEPNLFRARILPDLFSNECPLEEDPRCVHPGCYTSTPLEKLYKCTDCFNSQLYCAHCLINLHEFQPFHRVKSWTLGPSAFFAPDTLKAAGQIIQVGHSGGPCPEPGSTSDLNMMDIGGIFSITVWWCDCIDGVGKSQQLLHHNIFPATDDKPSTGYTFQLLKHYNQFSVTAKISAYDYVHCLEYLTNAADQSIVKNLYANFIKVSRQRRVLQMMKQAGVMLLSDLSPGLVTVPCPACPRPGINLPEGWRDDPNAALLYALFVSGDGNFHLQHRAGRKNLAEDPSFIGIAGYWADQIMFDRYVGARDPPSARKEPSCSTNTRAGDPTQFFKGDKLDVSGVFGISCRHVIFKPNAVIDLKKGEKFREVDVAFGSVVINAIKTGIMRIVASYDVACKFKVNYVARNSQGQEVLLTKDDLEKISITWLVPKFHLGGHEKKCSDDHSFNFTKDVGRTSGELVETPWAEMNKAKWITKQAGSGSRRDILIDLINWWNWLKTIKMCKLPALLPLLITNLILNHNPNPILHHTSHTI